MEKKTTGAWIIHHTGKLGKVTMATSDYENIGFAGKCGILLSALAGSTESQLTNSRVIALAKANNINSQLELPSILIELDKQRLIDKGEKEISILGLTTAQVLEHSAKIFEEKNPNPNELTAIDLADQASDIPILKGNASAYISDTYKLSTLETKEVLQQCEEIGFFDSENISQEQIYFNGNLFRREDMTKANAILNSLKPEENRKIIEITEKLKSSGCLSKEEVYTFLGEELYSKVCSIGFFDENSIGNETGTFTFITRPAAFSKFTNTTSDDAFDLAKAFVTSLTYGMTSSPYSRGRIRMIEALMDKLINGEWVGPATAIGQDYRILEMRGVVEVNPIGDGRFRMRLLKKEVGQLALAVITEGEVYSGPSMDLPGVSVTKYDGPEINRSIIRKKQSVPIKNGIAKLLNDLRTGGF